MLETIGHRALIRSSAAVCTKCSSAVKASPVSARARSAASAVRSITEQTTSRTRASRSGKLRYSVALPTPARRAISSSGTSGPCSTNISRAAVTIRSRLRRASARGRVTLRGAQRVAVVTAYSSDVEVLRAGRSGEGLPVSGGHPSKRGKSPHLFPAPGKKACDLEHAPPSRDSPRRVPRFPRSVPPFARSVSPSARPPGHRHRVIARAQPETGGCRGAKGSMHAAAAAVVPPHTRPGPHRHRHAPHTLAPDGRPRRGDRADPRDQHLGRDRPPHGALRRRADRPGPLLRLLALHDPRRPGRTDVRGRAHPARLRPLHGHGARPDPDGRLLRRPRAGQRDGPLPRVLPAHPGLVPHLLLRPPGLPGRDPGHRLAADAETFRLVRHRARRPLRTGLPAAGAGHRRRGRSQGRLPLVRPAQRADHPERRAARAGHGAVGDLRGERGRPGGGRGAGLQRLLHLLPPGRRLRLLPAHRLPGAAARERPHLRPARPVHPGRRGLGRALEHHERGLGRQQRHARLGQVEAGLAGRHPGGLRRPAGQRRVLPDPALPYGRRQTGDRSGGRPHGLRPGGARPGRQRRGGLLPRRPRLQGGRHGRHRARPGHRLRLAPRDRRLHPQPQRPGRTLRRPLHPRRDLQGPAPRDRGAGDGRGRRRRLPGPGHPHLTPSAARHAVTR
ncbi:exported hypothetical protein [Streptomyces misionensis JCM 4497]